FSAGLGGYPALKRRQLTSARFRDANAFAPPDWKSGASTGEAGMETLFQDLRYSVRMLVKSPAFTAVAVLTLALGIGANTAIFTLVNAVLLKMLPVKSPQELVIVGDPTAANERSNGTPQTDVVSYPLYKELRDQSSIFSGLCAAASDHHT